MTIYGCKSNIRLHSSCLFSSYARMKSLVLQLFRFITLMWQAVVLLGLKNDGVHSGQGEAKQYNTSESNSVLKDA